jgi:hypothetical protein
MHLLLALHCVTPSSLSTLDPTHPISLPLSLRVSIPSYLTDALVSWKERELPSQSEHLKHTTTTTTKLATENPRKYIQEESTASPPQVERFCKASPSLGVNMENGSRMRRTQKRERKTQQKQQPPQLLLLPLLQKKSGLGLPCNPGRRKKRKKKENWILL